MRALARASVLAVAVAVLITGCGDDSDPAQASKAGKPDKPTQPISYTEAKDKVDVKSIEKGEVTIFNKWGNRVQCDVPGYRGGAKFGIDESSARVVNANEVDGKKVVDVTCGDQRVSALNVTPSTEGAELEYVNELTFRQRGFNYVHSHLDFRDRGCEGQDPHTYSWAASRTGSCVGTYLAGSPPYLNEAGGVTTWERLGGSARKPVPSSVRGLAGPNDTLIKVTNARTEREPFAPIAGTRLECYVTDRSSGDCYTDFNEQRGKPAGSEGGPLVITVENGATRDYRYAFIRGFCRKSDPMCTPH